MVKKYVLEINMENAAFEEDEFGEVARILRELAMRIDGGSRNPFRRDLFDVNGNCVGEARVIKDRT